MFVDWSQPFALQTAAVATGDGKRWAVHLDADCDA